MIAFIFRPLLDWFLPRSLGRAAKGLGTLSIVLAVLVAVLFPVSAHAGTETTTARWITAGALAVAGFGLCASRGRLAVVGASIAVLVAGAILAPAPWLVLVAGGCCVYAGASLIPRGSKPAVARSDFVSGRTAGAAVGVTIASGGFAAPGPTTMDDEPPATETQEILESVALALCLALVVREFAFEAFKIPTGSMEPTIMGDRRPFRFSSLSNGDRLLAFKGVEIRRWDIAVFRFPLFRNTNYIKRTIGLPGEKIELRNGDVYVQGPGMERAEIVPKPDSVQQVMWQRAASPRADEEWIGKFDPDPANAWVLRKGYAEVDARGDAVAWLQADASYADDLRVSFDVDFGDAAPAGSLFVRLDGGRRTVTLQLDAQGAKVSAPGVEFTPEIGSLADFGTKFRLGLSMSDRVIRIWKDGRQVMAFQHPDVTNDGLDQGKIRIGAKGLEATIRDLVAENDVQYGMAGNTTWETKDDEYVMLGDNTQSSRDSRYWTANVVRTRDGREFVAPDRARVTEELEIDSFKTRPDGSVDFLDSYGIQHHFRKDEIEPVRRNVPMPFVKAADLVGRAFVVFYPFPPVGDFRPRFLR